MEEMWEYLLNHSPTLVCKAEIKTLKSTPSLKSTKSVKSFKSSKNPSENNLEIYQVPSNPQSINRSPLKPKQLNSGSKLSAAVAISKSKGKSPLSKPQSKIAITPVSSKKKLVPVLNSVKSSKVLKPALPSQTSRVLQGAKATKFVQAGQLLFSQKPGKNNV